MLFNSFEFLIFLPLVLGLYFFTPHRFRWILLLLSSYYFYVCWKFIYIALIFFSTILDYLAALAIDKTSSLRKKRAFLSISLVSNLGLLFFFKYHNFFASNINELTGLGLPLISFALPVGISFYTFQTMSYTIDVYQGKIKAERHLGIFALYVCFFPQLVAGPIERSKTLLPQFKFKQQWDAYRFYWGLEKILWGFFKKIVIADNIAPFISNIFDSPSEYGAFLKVLATYGFALQIYCDFSGYSDIAIGSAKVMGINLMENFRQPYFSQSIGEFWRRWHISLSTWFRDYIFIPLGGSRGRLQQTLSNIMITFLVSGLWHGANWTFVFWGGLNGFFLILEQVFLKDKDKKSEKGIYYWIRVLLTFHLICLSWIFFRAANMTIALTFLGDILSMKSIPGKDLSLMSYSEALPVLFAIVLLMIVDSCLHLKIKVSKHIEVVTKIVIVAFILIYGKLDLQSFIYFQF